MSTFWPLNSKLVFNPRVTLILRSGCFKINPFCNKTIFPAYKRYGFIASFSAFSEPLILEVTLKLNSLKPFLFPIACDKNRSCRGCFNSKTILVEKIILPKRKIYIPIGKKKILLINNKRRFFL